MVTTNELYWLAGLFEGEGTFFYRYDTHNVKAPCLVLGAAIKMTDRDVIEQVHKIMKNGTIYRQQYKINRIPTHEWRLNKRQDVAALMMTLYPLMGERRQAKIRECLKMWREYIPRNKRDRRTKEYYAWERMLNRLD